MPRFLLITVLLLSATLLFSQSKGPAKVDSMVNLLQSMDQEDTVKSELLSRLSGEYISLDPVKGIEYGNQSLEMATRLKWKKGQASAYNSLGNNYRMQSNYSMALECYLKALDINEEIRNETGMAHNYGNIGIIYKRMGDFDNALLYYDKSIQLNRKLNDSLGLAINLGNSGILYNTQKKHSKALEYELQALEICQDLGNYKSVAIWYGNISIVYNDSGVYQEAYEYAKRALAINDSLGVRKGVADNCRYLGMIMFGLSLDSTLSRSQKMEYRKSALAYLERAANMADGLGDLIGLQEINEIRYDIYMENGDFSNALDSYKLFVLYRDSVISEETKEKVTNLVTQRELLVKDKEIKIGEQQLELDRLAVEKKRNERVFFVIGLVLLVIVSAVIYRNYKHQQRTNLELAEEKNKSEDLLLNILPAKVAEEIKRTGAARAQHFDNVTVLFTDFVDFTHVAEQLSPQELVDELHECYKEFDAIVTKYGIEKIKTVGDAYLAVGGLPMADPDHAGKVIEVAIDICAFMKQRRELMGEKSFEVRIGINSGSVVAGIVGVKKIAYDIWGDVVNVASRLESSSESGRINISGATYSIVQNDSRFSFEFRGKIPAKNKGEIEMYYVTRRA